MPSWHIDLTKEEQLLLLCARTWREPVRDAAILERVDAGVDWTGVVQAALHHGLIPLLHRSLERVRPRSVPDVLLEALGKHCDDNARRCGQLSDELLRLVAEFAAHGIPAIAFKGPVLAAVAYGDPALRRAGDLDLLVQDQHAKRVCDLLTASGYRVQPEGLSDAQRQAAWRVCGEIALVRDRDGILVEPHAAIAPPALCVPLDYPGLWARSRPVALDGRDVPCFALEDLVLVLCVHASKHEWSELRWICDVAELVERYPNLAWSETLERARRQGCERMLLVGMDLAARLLGSALPGPVAQRLGADRKAVRLGSELGAALFDRDRAVPSVLVPSRRRLRLRERRRDRIGCLIASLAAPGVEHIQIVSLPRFAHALYTPLALLHAYLLVPVWNAFKQLSGWRGRTAAAQADRERRRARVAWSKAGEDWTRWSEAPGAAAQWLNEPLLDLAKIAPGQRVLDLACGAGEPALAISRLLEGRGTLVATDLALPMLIATRQRAQRAGTSGVIFCGAEMERLPFAAAHFDRVVSRLGIMFCSSPHAALAEARRVLRPGGRIALAVWGDLEANAIFEVLHHTLSTFFLEAYEAREPAAFRFASPGSLTALAREVGFEGVEEHEVRAAREAPGSGQFWQAPLEMSFGYLVRDLPKGVRVALDEALAADFALRLAKTGGLLHNCARIVAGRAA
jgi:ubiquinone/menaquinone biosynthesis C-methylase UbiE